MPKLYLTNALRHLRHSRLFTTLNILGLAIGISACAVIYRIVAFEFGFDTTIPDKAHTYRVVTGFKFDEKTSWNGGVAAPLYQELRKQPIGIRSVVPVFGRSVKMVQVNTNDGKPLTVDEQNGIVATDSAYFAMVPYQWIAGDAHTALRSPKQLVLTESRAKQYFPHQTPREVINKTITYFSWQDTVTYTVSGVVADPGARTEFTGKEFCLLPDKAYPLAEWTNTNGNDRLYLQLSPQAAPAHVLTAIETIMSEKARQFAQTQKNTFKYKKWFALMPLADSHFSTYIHEYEMHKADKKILYGLLGVAAFLLLLASINYINMSVASIPLRAREIGVRKTLGSSRRALIGQFLTETFVTTVAACAVAFFLAWAEFALLKDVIPAGLHPYGDVLLTIGFMLTLALVTSLLSGLYPGWLITKVKTIEVFRRAFVLQGGRGRLGFQRALIVFQFVIAIVFITGALVVGRQLHYVVSSDLGFDKEAVILASVPWKYNDNPLYKDKQFALFAELKALPGVRDVALGEPPLSKGYNSGLFEYYPPGKPMLSRLVYRKRVDTGYLRLYGFRLLAGRNLLSSDTTNELVINETAVKAFGFASPADALGKRVGQSQEPQIPIVGVISDFHSQNYYTTIDPLALMSRKSSLLTFNIKLSDRKTADWSRTLQAIEKKWYAFYPPQSFSYEFYDDTLAEIYKDDKNLGVLINLTTAISILISCFGLFGLAVLTAFQRTREIGIRKVLGASAAGIVGLLSKQYLQLVVIAFVIATPIAWWGANKWLQNFAYTIELRWWFFVLSGVAGMVVAFLTVGFHALKAATANPVKSLRTD